MNPRPAAGDDARKRVRRSNVRLAIVLAAIALAFYLTMLIVQPGSVG